MDGERQRERYLYSRTVAAALNQANPRGRNAESSQMGEKMLGS